MATALTPRDLLALGGAGLAIIALGAGAWLSLSGPATVGGAVPSANASNALLATAAPPAASLPAATELLVDVQGAVARPGIVRLAPGSRVADAISAAGGYTKLTDLLAAATSINLAAPLSDGAQVFVPITGVSGPGPSTAAGGGTGGGTGGSLVNLNTASPEELEALPNIGPVTVQKIVAARQEQPFATLEELVERGVMNRGQLEDIRALVTL
jgi:competence protein ComEA